MQQENHIETEEVTDIVVGLGVTGISVVRYLVEHGRTPMVYDSRIVPPESDRLLRRYPQVESCFGNFNGAMFARAERLIVNPGVSVNTPEIAHAKEQGVAVVGDIELFARAVDKPVIAITGSNGKSTVTMLVGSILKACGMNPGVGGNIGIPALDLLEKGHDIYVLELSSFQLETTSSLQAAAATVLNVSEDHLDRYATMQEYTEAKRRIYNNADFAVVNRDDTTVNGMNTGSKQKLMFTLGEPAAGEYGVIRQNDQLWLAYGDEKLLQANELKLDGLHNVANVLAALALVHSLKLDRNTVLDACRAFHGLHHRTEVVAEISGVKWVNDSKATNVGATRAALEGLGENIILIAGGESKDQDLLPLRDAVDQHAKTVILIGRDAEKLADVCAGVVDIHFARSMQEAVRTARSISKPGDTVLLSPACASFDMFDNYMQRGDVFAAAVKEAQV